MAISPSLDGPPPSPANPPMPGAGGPGGPPGAGAQGPGGPMQPVAGSPNDPIKAMVALGQKLDMALGQLAQGVPEGASEFSQAKQLVQAGLAKALQKGPGAVASSPTSPGNGPQFPSALSGGGA